MPPTSPGFYSNVFLVRKASGGWHPVIDLKSLNAHIWAPHFRMYTTSSVLSTGRNSPTHGFPQLGLRSHPSGSSVPEAVTTLFSFFRPDRSVYTTASVRPLGPCQLTSAMAGPIFSYLWNPYPSVSGGIYDFHGRLQSGLGRPHGGFPNFGYMGPSGPRAPYQLLGTQGGRAALHHWAPVLQGHPVMIATDHSTVVSYIKKQGRNQVPLLVTSGSGAFCVVRSSEHSCPSKTHPRLSKCDSRPPISSQSADTDRVESPP